MVLVSGNARALPVGVCSRQFRIPISPSVSNLLTVAPGRSASPEEHSWLASFSSRSDLILAVFQLHSCDHARNIHAREWPSAVRLLLHPVSPANCERNYGT